MYNTFRSAIIKKKVIIQKYTGCEISETGRDRLKTRRKVNSTDI